MAAPANTAPLRNPAIDQFRGLAILMMFAANYLEHIRIVPPWLKHAPDIGITVIDFIAPLFIFAIGLTYAGSVRRRLRREGWRKTLEHLLMRSLALIGIGALFSIGEVSYGFGARGIQWGVLQAIGASILLVFPVLFLPAVARLAVALAWLAGYQWALDAYWLPTVLSSSHAGIQGSLSWAALLMLATVYGDFYAAGQARRYWATAAAMLAAGIVLGGVIPVSKHRMSLPFDLIVSSAGAVVFGVTHLLVNRRGVSARCLEVFGANPLVLYISHLFLLAVFLVPAAPWWHFEAAAWQAALQGVCFVAALYALGAWLYSRKIIVSL